MAIRYTDEKKKEVLTWIQDYDKANGRGGQTEASKKFKISALTLSNWRKKTAPAKAGKRGSEAKSATKQAKGRAGSSELSVVLGRMTAVRKEIESLEAEYQALKKRL